MEGWKDESAIAMFNIDIDENYCLEALEKCLNYYSNWKILSVSAKDDDELFYRIIQTGCHGFVSKNSSLDELLTGFRAVAGGGKFFSKSRILENIKFEVSYEDETSNFQYMIHKTLSKKELAVFLLTARGKSIKEISEELTVDPSTVSVYKNKIFKKTKMKSEIEIARYCIELNLI